MSAHHANQDSQSTCNQTRQIYGTVLTRRRTSCRLRCCRCGMRVANFFQFSSVCASGPAGGHNISALGSGEHFGGASR